MKKNLSRKLWVLLLTAAMVISLIPCGARTAYADTGEVELDDPDDILNLTQEEPKELDQYPDNVYDVEKGQPFLLSEQNELALIVSNPENSEKNQVIRFDNFDLDLKKKEGDECWINGITLRNAETEDADLNYSPYKNLQCLQSIGFDRDGTGRKQYIASVGIDKSSMLTVVIQNAVTGTYDTLTIENVSDVNNAQYWTKDNYLAITAGDYDGDGRDSVVIYVCGNSQKENSYAGFIGLKEITFSKSGEASVNTLLDLRSSFLDMGISVYMQTVDHIKYKPSVSLATGDFNGDGRQQLAFSAGWYNVWDSIRDGCTQNLTSDDLSAFSMTLVGICDRTSSGWTHTSPIRMIERGSDFTLIGNIRTYPVTGMHAGAIAAGDVNNDGIDEIVAVGYTSLTPEDSEEHYARMTYKDGVPESIYNIGDFSRHKMVTAVICRSGSGYKRTGLQLIDMPQAISSTFTQYCDDKDWVFTKAAVACAKTNGANTPETVMINGVLYSFEKLSPNVILAPSFISANNMTDLAGNPNFISSVNWIRNIAVGNFNGNDAGREQFVFTFWQKWKGEANYAASIGAAAGVEYEDQKSGGVVVNYGAPKHFACSIDGNKLMSITIENTIYDRNLSAGKIFGPATESSSCILNTVPVAVDIDDDGVMGRFSKSGYVYTDPEVLAVLEAGPYFKEIEQAGGYEDPCQTSYSFSTSFGTGTSRTKGSSFEVGVAAEASAGPVKVSLEAGYSTNWSHTYETSYKVTKTSRFIAQSQDVVVMYRVPELIYTYDIWNKETGKWVENGMNVRVPLTPVYFTLGVDDYNEFVDQYNALLKPGSTGGLIKIVEGEDLPLDHEGNPDNYWSDWALAGGDQLSDTDYDLSYYSGSVACEYEEEAAETESQEVGHSFHFSMMTQAGGSYLVGEAWAGAYANLDFNESTGRSTTKVDTSAKSGQVQNIKASAVNGLTVSQVKSGYFFKWNFGKWTRTLSKDGNMVVPFYGYTVFKVKRRALPPTLGTIKGTVETGYAAFSVSEPTAGLDKVLTVTKVSGNAKITYDETTKSIQVAAGLAKGTYTATFKISNGLTNCDKTFKYTLTVKPYDPDAVHITTQPADKTVAVGKTAKLSVTATGAGLSYQWYYRTSSTGSWKAVSAASGKTAAYSLTAQAKHDGYQYYCKVKGTKGSLDSDIVTLKVKPAITTQPSDVKVAVGKKAVFTVAAEGATAYQW